MFDNDKLTLRRKIVLSLGLLVGAMILIFAQYRGIKAKPERDVENNMMRKERIQPDLNEIRDFKNVNDSSKTRGENRNSKNNEIPAKSSNTNNRLFESI